MGFRGASVLHRMRAGSKRRAARVRGGDGDGAGRTDAASGEEDADRAVRRDDDVHSVGPRGRVHRVVVCGAGEPDRGANAFRSARAGAVGAGHVGLHRLRADEHQLRSRRDVQLQRAVLLARGQKRGQAVLHEHGLPVHAALHAHRPAQRPRRARRVRAGRLRQLLQRGRRRVLRLRRGRQRRPRLPLRGRHLPDGKLHGLPWRPGGRAGRDGIPEGGLGSRGHWRDGEHHGARRLVPGRHRSQHRPHSCSSCCSFPWRSGRACCSSGAT